MEIKLEDLSEELKKQVISEHYRKMAKRSHNTIKNRYGTEYYSKMKQKAWDKKKADNDITVSLG